MKYSAKDYNDLLNKAKGFIPKEDSYGTIYKNGFVSKTLQSVLIAKIGNLQWIGTEILIMDNIKENTMSFSAIASTKCVVFWISHEDLKLIPVNLRNLLTHAAHHRVEKNINQRFNQY